MRRSGLVSSHCMSLTDPVAHAVRSGRCLAGAAIRHHPSMPLCGCRWQWSAMVSTFRPPWGTPPAASRCAERDSDVALETSDVALMSDDLNRLPIVMSLSRTASAIMRQNHRWFSLAMVAVLIPETLRLAGHRTGGRVAKAPRRASWQCFAPARLSASQYLREVRATGRRSGIAYIAIFA